MIDNPGNFACDVCKNYRKYICTYICKYVILIYINIYIYIPVHIYTY